MGPPEIRYLQRDGKDFAYQVVGRGAQNAINVLEMATHLDLLWADPSWAQQWARFEQAALPPVVPHALRRTYIGLMLEAGMRRCTM